MKRTVMGFALGVFLLTLEPRMASGVGVGLVPIGVTGIEVSIVKDSVVKVEAMQPGSPAEGKFNAGTVLLGVNGAKLGGSQNDLLMVLGTALTAAEAKDGVLTFDVKTDKGEPSQVTITIPILGEYGETFPLDSEKSKTIIKRAAGFYADKDRMKEHDLWSALACLFLLSTGDDAYVPRVREYFHQFLDKRGEWNPSDVKDAGEFKGVGQNTWHNGYNGVACAEYYLRTGDKSVLPLMQYYCDDARDRQKFGVGWGHWGYGVNPAYEAGGGMQHSAGNQMLLTLLLGKKCGVDVDDKALLGALRHWYRFVGHGTIPVSDTRPWFILRSAGRDGATAAVMHIACGAQGDVSIYRQAKEYLALSNITSWPETSFNFEIYWHSLADPFMLDYEPARYYATMQRQQWRYDIGRQSSGAFWAAREKTDPLDSGISLALAYTGPLKTLQITGAPRSKHAKDFTLPEHLWGNEADLAFLSARHHPDFYKHGKEEDIDVTFRQLPLRLRYSPDDMKDLPLDTMLRDVRHARWEVRTAAAKALCVNRRFGELEALLRDPDPRLRRAALDGMNDYHAWFLEPEVGKHALAAEDYTPAMIQAITAMLNDPTESWYVVDGALHALNHAPIEVIEKNIPGILPWTTHEEWWLREAAFMALMGLRDNEALFLRNLPTLIDVMVKEYPYNPRYKMRKQLQDAFAKWTFGSPVGKQIVAGFTRAALESEILPDAGLNKRSQEGAANVVEVVLASIKQAPECAAELAEALVQGGRLASLETDGLMKIVKAKDGNVGDRFVGLLPAVRTLPQQQKDRLTSILCDTFLPELVKRFQASEEREDGSLLELLVELTQLKRAIPGWVAIGSPSPSERLYRFRSFDPATDAERLHHLIGPPERMRTVTLPAGMEDWFKPGFDDNSWKSGRLPIGVGVFKAHGHGRGWTATPERFIANNSDWGNGEFLALRTTIKVEDLDYDYVRLVILSDQGYRVYLNGHEIHSYVWFQHYPQYQTSMVTAAVREQLKKGTNTLAVYGNVRYEQNKETGGFHPVGQLDLWLEGLKKADLGL